MRLIDADKLIEELTIKAVSKDAHIISIANAVVNLVNNQPTAYSVDKVVEELEIDSSVKLYGSGNSDNYLIPVNRAIEIVKQGVISDDVCEWEKGSSGYVGYSAYYSKCCTTNSNGLEMQTHIISDWKYCPYCGKKMKIVGD